MMPEDQAAESETKCPACGAVLYSRRARICGVCEAKIPDELRITGERADKIGKLVHEALVRIHRDEQEEAEDTARGSRQGGY